MNEEPWLQGLSIFYDTWFPENAKEGLVVPGFWFGARKASYRSFFESLASNCVKPARTLVRARLATTAGWLHWDLQCTARWRMKAAIFLDQMSRNYLSMQRGNAMIAEGNDFKMICDSVALPLALSVLMDVGFTCKEMDVASSQSLLQLGSVPELCFLSLVLRHAREAYSLKLSEHMLLGILQVLSKELAGRTDENDRSLKGHQELCQRFLEETRDAIEAIEVEKYLETALSNDRPIQLPGKPVHSPRLSVLDARCQEYAGDTPHSWLFLNPLKAADLSIFEGHYLVEELRKQLDDLGYLRSDLGIVLSLSGGVDSMVTCCLLWLLQRTLPPEQRFRWCAMHLCHPNRDDAQDEEGWVQWSCSELDVDLRSYRPQIRRPHGNVKTGISRERYEEKSKQLRFRMYELCLTELKVTSGAALVAHHEDDADENRLAELGKGNIVHIDGMSASGTTLNVTVLRPLLKVRKSELIEFARLAKVCYMQDSTPKWSRRGWIRHVLDEMKIQHSTRFAQLQALLSRAGAASEALGESIDLSLNSWKEAEIFTGLVAVPAGDFSERKSEKKEEVSLSPVCYAACEVRVVVLRMPTLFKLSEDFQEKVKSLMEDFRQIAQIWNEAIAQQSSVPAEIIEDDAEHPGNCPLQKITVCDGRFEMGPFVLGRGLCVAMNAVSEVDDLLKGQLAARKALKHVWDCVVRARREHHWGTMHKSCPFLYAAQLKIWL